MIENILNALKFSTLVELICREIKLFFGFTRQSCCMIGTMKMFCIGNNIFSHRKKIDYCSCHATWQPSKTSIHVKSAYEPSGPSGRSLSRFPWHEATRNISTPPRMGRQSIAGLNLLVPIYTPGWREAP